MRKRHRLLTGVAILLVGLGIGSGTRWALASDPADLPGADQSTAEQTSHSGGTDLAALEDPAGKISWKLVSYNSADGECRDWIANEIGGSDKAMTGGCGDALDTPFDWSAGGVRIGGQWYNVLYGNTIDDATQVRLNLTGGNSQTAPITDGVWLFAIPTHDAFAGQLPGYDSVQALDQNGQVIATEDSALLQRIPSVYANAVAMELARPATFGDH